MAALEQDFTPLTDILVEVMLAAAAPGDASMTMTEFLAKIRSDATFAAGVSSQSSVSSYRNAVAELVRERVRAAGGNPALLGAALHANFESAIFSANGTDPHDKLLDDLQSVLLDPNGNVLSAVISQAKTNGDAHGRLGHLLAHLLFGAAALRPSEGRLLVASDSEVSLSPRGSSFPVFA